MDGGSARFLVHRPGFAVGFELLSDISSLQNLLRSITVRITPKVVIEPIQVMLHHCTISFWAGYAVAEPLVQIKPDRHIVIDEPLI